MSDSYLSVEAHGLLAKVVYVSEDGETIHYRLQNGVTARGTVDPGILPQYGDVILVGDRRWEHAPVSVWPELNSIGTVSRILDNGAVLIDSGVSLKKILNRRGVTLQVGNTVEFNDLDGVVEVVSETPVRSHVLERTSDSDDGIQQYLIPGTENGPTFSDFGGYVHVKERARELIETQLRRRDYLKAIGARPVKGILFTGAPGTGKTHLARIIAHESQADFYLVSGPSIVSKWLGDTEHTLRQLFDAAVNGVSDAAIIFFDEIDSIAERRSGDSHEASRRLVAQLLTLLDGFDTQEKGVVVIAATNRADALDPALTRPGRFDWEIEFGMPTLYDRLEILRVRARQLATLGELPLEDIALLAEGWSGADLTAIWTEAALVAAGDRRRSVSGEDVALAYERVARRPRRSHETDVRR